MINIIYGPSKSGKTAEIKRMIKKDVENGMTVFLIVPEQQILSAERSMLDELPPKAQLCFSVASFSRLSNMVFRKYGGLSYNYITPGMKTLYTWLAIKEATPALKEYAPGSVRDENIPTLIANIISEFKASEINADDLSAAAESLESGDTLKKKLEDLALIYAIYDSMIHENFDDPSDDLDKLADILGMNNYFEGCSVYFDSFTGFTAQEYSIIKNILRQAENVAFTLCTEGPSCRLMHFSTPNETARKIKRMAMDICGNEGMHEYLLKDVFTDSPELKTINKYLWDYSISKPDVYSQICERHGDIEYYICKNTYTEAQMVANYIMKLVSKGYRFRDIAVIYRNAKSRIGIIDAVFEKCSIPYFMSQSTDITLKPIVKFILSALRIYIYNYNPADVMSFFKTGLSGFSAIDIDIFSDYCTTWNIRGNGFRRKWTMNPDGYIKERSERATRILDTAETVRNGFIEKMDAFCQKLSSSESAGQISNAIYELLVDFDVAEHLNEIAKKEAELGYMKDAEETLQLYDITVGILSDMAVSVGKVKMDAAEYLTALRILFMSTDIDTIPTSADQVTVGSADHLRLNNIKCVFVCGLCDGELPMNVTESVILNNSERLILASEAGLKLSAAGENEAADELFYAYTALTASSEKLIMSSPEISFDGSPTHPSSVITRIRFLFPDLKFFRYDDLPAESKYYCPQLALEAIGDGVKDSADRAILGALQSTGQYGSVIPYIGKRVSEPDCVISKELSEKIFGKRIRLTQTRLDKYMKCRMSYYCANVLRLRVHSKAEFRKNNVGTFIHYVLEHILSYLTERSLLGRNNRFAEENNTQDLFDDSELDGILDMIISGFVSETYPDEISDSNRMKHLIEKMKRLARLLVNNIREEFSDSDFLPKFFELNIGYRFPENPKPLEIRLESGETVSISGVADRVDVYRKDNRIYIRVVDYKTGGKDFALSDIKEGQNLQTFLYLFAICRCSTPEWRNRLGAEKSDTVVPAGAVYLSSKISTLHPENILDDTEVMKLAADGFKRKGVTADSPEILHAISHTLSKKIIPGGVPSGSSGVDNKFLLSEQKFDELYNDIEDIIKKITADILTGNASARPYSADNGTCEFPDETVCQYCDMKSFCRIQKKQAFGPSKRH